MSSVFDKYQVVIGLECHTQLLTSSKLFSPGKNNYGDSPNENVDVIDIALPGTLPVLNEKAVRFAIALGLAMRCKINQSSTFARKHYFYPDLPKGYQISQFDEPVCGRGELLVDTPSGTKIVGITRIHLEEDAGKNIHVDGGAVSFVDYNRAGTPLLEIVTEPDLRSAEDAMATLRAIRSMVTYLGVCDGNMQEGSIRADVNVSVHLKTSQTLGTRAEIKNLNSMRFLGQAVEYEFRRQVLELEAGRPIVQETRLWDSNLKETRTMRSKEESHDYRYFPDPDLLPLTFGQDLIEAVKSTLPELAPAKIARFCQELNLSKYDAEVLTAEKEIADYFEAAVSTHANAKSIANWVINDVLRIIKSKGDEEVSGIKDCAITPAAIGSLVKLIDSGDITGKIAKQVFEHLVLNPELTPLEIVEKNGWKTERDSSVVEFAIDQVIAEFPTEVASYKSGKVQIFGFLMGQLMQKTKGKASPQEATAMLKSKLQ